MKSAQLDYIRAIFCAGFRSNDTTDHPSKLLINTKNATRQLIIRQTEIIGRSMLSGGHNWSRDAVEVGGGGRERTTVIGPERPMTISQLASNELRFEVAKRNTGIQLGINLLQCFICLLAAQKYDKNANIVQLSVLQVSWAGRTYNNSCNFTHTHVVSRQRF